MTSAALGLLALLLSLFVAQAAPVVSNVRASQRAGTGLVDIYYDVTAGAPVTVSVAISTNSGVAYNLPSPSLSGDLGGGITPANGKHVVWNAGANLSALYFPNVRVRVTADDSTAPSWMALIPGGSFTMGNCFGVSEGSSAELPLHTVYISAFYMDRYDITKSLWDSVYQWAITHGYSFEYVAAGKASNHPAQSMTWYDAVKWCNARSEKEGRVAAYYTSAAQTTVYRTGQVNVDNASVKWNAGYRLPTDAEWEKAARGGASGHRFPWSDSDTVTQSRANYYSTWSGGTPYYSYDVNPTSGYHPTFATGGSPYTSPVDYFAPNGYGLYDMAGNVWQWCWDWYGSYSSGSQTDPRGPSSGSYRVIRGGGWLSRAINCRTASRLSINPARRSIDMGFRSVLPPGQ